jgi:hypothetical protein
VRVHRSRRGSNQPRGRAIDGGGDEFVRVDRVGRCSRLAASTRIRARDKDDLDRWLDDQLTSNQIGAMRGLSDVPAN